MTRAEALALCDELERIVGDDPGPDEDGVRRVEVIRRTLTRDPKATRYLDEKVGKAANLISGYWLRARRWKRYGADPSRLRALVGNAIAGVRRAIETAWSK
jgi:hypothetical protein